MYILYYNYIMTCTLVYQTVVSLQRCTKYLSKWMGSPVRGEHRYACVSDNGPTLEPYFNELLGSLYGDGASRLNQGVNLINLTHATFIANSS